MPKKILITGATGQVGQSLKNAADRIPTLKAICVDRRSFDLSDGVQMKKTFEEINPDFIINAAAYTQVDQAEEDEKKATEINAEACQILAKMCHKANIPLIHYSTDYVYHNGLDRPLIESDERKPKSVYGKTKAQGEDYIRETLDNHFILRTSWVYDALGTNFVRTMLSLADRFPELTVVDDQIGSPTYAPDIADVSLAIVQRYFANSVNDDQYGTYNFSNEGVCSWFDFAKAIFEISNIDIVVKPVPTTAFPRPAARPHYSVMNKAKIRDFLPEYTIPYWKESLSTCLQTIQSQ